ncbi:MAG: SUMF1/EgtB/PvdO family nonheme iron enzyme [Prevotellaceae bacterium]|nr:SUMF1/EgtB/PvdO family nonheme iron enzyme [Prevotellaceae bacterium]
MDFQDYIDLCNMKLEYPDRDGDGVPDKDDDCPDQAGPKVTKGCPDRDGDGEPEIEDECPDQSGSAVTRGCSDTDGDGIPDKDDRCPDLAGPKELQGCPDKDGDGIPDRDDRCPDQPGSAVTRGCPDTDGDSIPDKDDRCPDLAGPKELQGCPDRDGDNIPDKDDKCPDQADPISLIGCPDIDGDGVPDRDDESPDQPGPAYNKGTPDIDGDRRSSTQRHPAESEMVFVQGGAFLMGCTSEQSDCWDDEKPVHEVTLSSFFIGKYEVTQAQWKALMGTNPSNSKGDNLPVEKVSWNEVQIFIERLNDATGKQYRLPTEAEWEYAARGGNKSKGYKYSGSNLVEDVAWMVTNSGDVTNPVGTKPANELGIYDMSGNVWEWCSDWKGIYPASAQNNPAGVSSSSSHVRRGGSWNNAANSCRVANRPGYSPGNSDGDLGFRLACSSE